MSIQLVKAGRRRTVMCSDSRASADDGTIELHHEKLFQVGGFGACGITGILHVAPGDAIAPRIKNLLRDGVWQSPEAFLQALARELYPALERSFAENSRTFEAALVRGVEVLFGALCVMRKPSGEVDLMELRFSIVRSDAGSPELTEPEFISHASGTRAAFVYGVGPEATPFSDKLPALNPDLDDAHVIAAFDSVIEGYKTTWEYGNDIGGPIDVAAIDATGFRWLRKKTIVEARIDDVSEVEHCAGPLVWSMKDLFLPDKEGLYFLAGWLTRKFVSWRTNALERLKAFWPGEEGQSWIKRLRQ